MYRTLILRTHHALAAQHDTGASYSSPSRHIPNPGARNLVLMASSMLLILCFHHAVLEIETIELARVHCGDKDRGLLLAISTNSFTSD